jgi:predicted permease
MLPRFGLRPGVRRLFRLPVRGAAGRMREIDDELAAVLQARVDDFVARGMQVDEARQAALRALGAPVTTVRESLHSSQQAPARRMTIRDYLADAAQDVRYALRGLLRTPGFTAVVLLTLAIGIGATTAIFSAVDALLLRPLPFPQPQQLMKLDLVAPELGRLTGSDAMLWSYPKFAEFRARQRVFSTVAVYESMRFAVTAPQVNLILGESVNAGYLRTLGVRMVIGRNMDAGVGENGGPAREVVVGYSLWQSRFAADPDVIGRTLEIDRVPYTIVGVTEPGFRGLSGTADLFADLTARRGAGLKGAHSYVFNVIARRKPGITADQALAATSILGTQVNRDFIKAGSPDSSWRARAVPLDAVRVSSLVRRSILILFGAVSLVLLIACVNVANLLLGRASKRHREMSVRLAIGANSGRLVRLLLTESIVLAAAGGIFGIALAWAGAHALQAIDASAALGSTRSAIGAISFSSIHLDWRALAFITTLSLAVGLVFGLVPVAAVRRMSLATALRAGATERSRATGSRFGGRRALVVAEVALSMVLLAGSGLMLRSLAKLLTTDYGFDGSHVLALRLTDFSNEPVRDVFQGFWAGVTRELKAVPGVTAVGLGSCGPLEGGCGGSIIKSIDGLALASGESPLVDMNIANAGWFAALHVPLLKGRLFDAGDVPTGQRVVVVNEAAAHALFPNQPAIGHIIGATGGLDAASTIVGVVGNVRQFPDSAAPPQVFIPLSQFGHQRLEIFLRTEQDPASVAQSVRRALTTFAPSAAQDGMETLDQRTGSATARARLGALLIGLFAATALSLALIGVYGVMSLAVGARTREIGVRIALGADVARVRRLVIADAMTLVVAGGALGIAGAVLCTRVLRSLLFDLSTTDPATYLGIALLLIVTAFGAAWLPARRASRIDPMQALRVD